MFARFRHWLGPLVSCLGFATLQAASVPNASFEENQFSVAPGYASQNGGAINGWTVSGKVGLNRAGEAFADNGAVPDGLNVAFLQSGADVASTLATTLTGLTPGCTYTLKFRANMRGGTAAPAASYSIGGAAPVSFTASPAVGGTNAYLTVSTSFVATQADVALVVKNQTAADSAVLVDDFRLLITTDLAGAGTVTPIEPPALGMTWMFCKQGVFPFAGTTNDSSDPPYLGEIRLFAAPAAYLADSNDWVPCDGRELQISQNAAIFYLLSTTYGGNGQTTFRLPDLRGRVPMGAGQAPGLALRTVGQSGGGSVLDAATLPAHHHNLPGGGSTEDEGQGKPLSCLPPYLVVQPFLMNAGDPNSTAAVRWYAGVMNTPGLPCDGAMLDANAYPDLFAQVGHTFGGSDDSFQMPDLRGRIAIGMGNGADLTSRALGETGGTDSGVVLSAASLPAHVHGLQGGSAGYTTSTGGAGVAVPTMPPFLVLNPQVALNGVYENSYRAPAIGEVRWFVASPEQVATFETSYWASCDGGSVSRGEYSTYEQVVTNVWGGDDWTIKVPDLRGRMAVNLGQAGTLPSRALADAFGKESIQLTLATMASHSHAVATTTTTTLTRRHGVGEGATVTFAAEVNGLFGSPSGTADLYEGETLLASGALDAVGIAEFPDLALPAGTHTLHVRYSGDGVFTASTSPFYFHSSQGWSAAAWRDDGETGISTLSSRAHRFHSTTSATIGGKVITGVAGANPAVSGEFAVNGMGLLFSGDVNALTALTGSGSAEIATSFVYNGNPGTIVLQSLTPGTRYVVTLLSVGFDPTGTRRCTFASGADSLVVNQDQYGNDQGVRVDYVFDADAATRTITLTPENAGRSFHLYAMALRAVTSSMAVHNGTVVNAGTKLTSGSGSQALPNTFPGNTSATRTFTIVNTGTSYLNHLALTMTGAQAGEFPLGALGKTQLAPGEATTFTVAFQPLLDGTRQAVLEVAGAGAPFLLNLEGTSPVTTVNEATDAGLRAAIDAANSASGPMTIKFNVPGGGVIALASTLPVLRNPSGIRIDGANGGQGAIALDGGATSNATGQRIFYVGVTGDTPGGYPTTAATEFRISNLILQNGNARGASGTGGGGAGMGGAVFLNAGSLLVKNVAFSNNRAVGGNGGVGQSGGNGGALGGGTSGGGGGPGLPNPHSNGYTWSGSGGAGANGSGGGQGGSGGPGEGGDWTSGSGSNTTSHGGVGGAGGLGGTAGSGGFGGGGGSGGTGGTGGPGTQDYVTHTANSGGVGGSGGIGGNGGFGGGGGGGGAGGTGGEGSSRFGYPYGWYGGTGATGGAGGAGGSTPGTGGFAAGNGIAGGAGSSGSPGDIDLGGAGGAGGVAGAGGGGAGLGGAVFVRQGASLTVIDGAMAGGSVAGGVGGNNGIATAGNGQGIGTGIFLAGNTAYEVTGSNTVTIADVLAGGSHSLISGGLTKTGTGTLVLAAPNSYVGATVIQAGTLGVGHDNAIPAGTITINGGGIRAVGSARTLAHPLAVNGGFVLGRSTTLNGAMTLNQDVVIVSTNPDAPAGGGTSTLGGVISGAHSITFAEGPNPIGTLRLTATNTFTGNTIVAGGIVSLFGSNTILPNSTKVIFQGSTGVLDLSGGTETVSALYVGTTQQMAGTWGATGSGATYIDNVHFSGTGMLNVTTGPTFASWVADKGLSGADAGFDADPNRNGISNGIEFVLGGEPALAGTMPPLPTVVLQGNNIVFTFKRADIAAGLNPVVEFQTGLGGTWITAVNGSNATIQVSNGIPADTVTVTIPSNGASKMFARLKVTQ